MPSSFKAKLSEKTQLAKDIYFFKFDFQDGKEINFISGQYVFFKIGDATRLYSIASPEENKKEIELIIKIHHPKGIASNYFSNMQVGTVVDIYGPAGFFKLNNTTKPKKIIAFGTGIVPFISIFKSLIGKSVDFDINLFWGLKTAKDSYFLEDLKEIKNNIPRFKYHICLSQEEDLSGLDSAVFKQGRVNGHVLNDGRIEDCEYYLCGQQEVVMSTNLFLLGNGVKRENIFFEIY